VLISGRLFSEEKREAPDSGRAPCWHQSGRSLAVPGWSGECLWTAGIHDLSETDGGLPEQQRCVGAGPPARGQSPPRLQPNHREWLRWRVSCREL